MFTYKFLYGSTRIKQSFLIDIIMYTVDPNVS